MVSTPTARSATCGSFGDLSATSSSAGTPTTRKMRASGKPSLERVKVHCRLRPFLGPEEEIGGADSVVRKLSAKRAATPKDGEDPPPDVVALRNETFQFDSFLGAQTSQETVYERVAAPIVSSVLQGYNGTVFAYGQTGSGKTFSMFGGKSSKEAGIVPRALVHIFKEINEDEAFEYSVTLSYVQLYCELLTDLLSPNGPEDGSSDGVGASVGGAPTSTGPGGHKSLLIREDTKRGIFIEGVKCAAVESAEEAMAMIQEGDEHRVRAATNMNAASSRSHACIILNITKRKCAESAQAGGKKSKVKFGKLILVDLAGSERVKKALGENHSHHGTRFMESKAINLSLSALGNCISALAQRKQHIPYRDAKLTRLLKDSLGGNSMTALVLNVAPHESFASETKSTLTFGQRAMAVQTRVTINEQVDFQALYSSVQASLDHKDDRIHELEIALSKVRIELNDARQQADKAEQERSMASMQLSSLSVSADVADQVGLLQAEHARAVDALRNEFESKISAEKQRASSAQEEWHRIEYELKDEREEHLRTCALLREKQAQLAEVEQSKEDRIAELFEDLKASQERSDAARAETEAVEAERVRLAAENASMRAELDKGREFQERGLQLMETLTSRVESLEERKRRAQEPETGSQSPSLHSSRRLESEGRHESRASRQARHISSLTKPKRHPSRVAPEVPVVPRSNNSSTSRASHRSGSANMMMTSSSNNNNNNNNNNEYADEDGSATDRYSARTNGSSDPARRWKRSSSAASTGVGLGRRGSAAGGGSSSSRVGSATASILRF